MRTTLQHKTQAIILVITTPPSTISATALNSRTQAQTMLTIKLRKDANRLKNKVLFVISMVILSYLRIVYIITYIF